MSRRGPDPSPRQLAPALRAAEGLRRPGAGDRARRGLGPGPVRRARRGRGVGRAGYLRSARPPLVHGGAVRGWHGHGRRMDCHGSGTGLTDSSERAPARRASPACQDARSWTMRMADRQRRQSSALRPVGAATAPIGLATALSGLGLTSLALLPLQFSGAAILLPSRRRVTAALCVWSCWCFGRHHVLWRSSWMAYPARPSSARPESARRLLLRPAAGSVA